MFIETSLPRKPGDKAHLLSPKYPGTNGQCLQFWYHMYGRHIGTLNVRIRRLVQGKPTYFLQWSRTGDHGNRWRVAQVKQSHIVKFYTRVFHTGILRNRDQYFVFICPQLQGRQSRWCKAPPPPNFFQN